MNMTSGFEGDGSKRYTSKQGLRDDLLPVLFSRKNINSSMRQENDLHRRSGTTKSKSSVGMARPPIHGAQHVHNKIMKTAKRGQIIDSSPGAPAHHATYDERPKTQGGMIGIKNSREIRRMHFLAAQNSQQDKPTSSLV